MKKIIALLLLSTFSLGSVVSAYAASNNTVSIEKTDKDKDKDKDKKKNKKGSCCSSTAAKSCGSAEKATETKATEIKAVESGNGGAAPAKTGGCCSKSAAKSCSGEKK